MINSLNDNKKLGVKKRWVFVILSVLFLILEPYIQSLNERNLIYGNEQEENNTDPPHSATNLL